GTAAGMPVAAVAGSWWVKMSMRGCAAASAARLVTAAKINEGPQEATHGWCARVSISEAASEHAEATTSREMLSPTEKPCGAVMRAPVTADRSRRSLMRT